MTASRVLLLVLSLSCAFLLGREMARRGAMPEPPGPGYDVQLEAAHRAQAALTRSAAVQPTFVEVADRLRPSVVSIHGSDPSGEQSSGTGLIVSADGAVLTNNHVIRGLSKITVTLSSSDWYPATIVGQDEPTDLALIRMEGVTGLLPATFGDSDALRVAEDVLAIGNAYGLGWTVTRGIISSLHRSMIVDEDLAFRKTLPYTDYIQTDAAINLGNSGGPIVNARGEVIGVSVAILSRAPSGDTPLGYATGIGFGIPSNDAKFVASELLQRSRVRRGYLGLTGTDLSAKDKDLRRRIAPGASMGAVVDSVQPGTPAERAGLNPEDVILELDGRPIESFSVLRNRIARTPPRTEVVLKVTRAGKQRDVRALIGQHPDSDIDEPAKD
jgi:S1-C subfamily serine protease